MITKINTNLCLDILGLGRYRTNKLTLFRSEKLIIKRNKQPLIKVSSRNGRAHELSTIRMNTTTLSQSRPRRISAPKQPRNQKLFIVASNNHQTTQHHHAPPPPGPASPFSFVTSQVSSPALDHIEEEKEGNHDQGIDLSSDLHEIHDDEINVVKFC